MKKLLILSVIISVGSISYASALGGYDAGAVNSQYMRDLRMHEFSSAAKNKSAIVKTTSKADEKPDIPASATIKTIRFSNNNAITSSDLARITSSYLNTSANEESIAAIRKQIIRYYQANGYYSAIAFPDTSNLASGELIFEIKEGTKNSIVVE